MLGSPGGAAIRGSSILFEHMAQIENLHKLFPIVVRCPSLLGHHRLRPPPVDQGRAARLRDRVPDDLRALPQPAEEAPHSRGLQMGDERVMAHMDWAARPR